MRLKRLQVEIWPTLRTASEGGPYKSKEGSAALRGEELGEGEGGVGGLHELFADEEGVEACGAEFDEVGVGAEAGFADGDTIIGNVGDEFEGRFAADFESFQVAIIDTDDACGCGEGAIEFSGSVNFDERLHGEFTAEGGLKDRNDPFLYWLIPIMIEPKSRDAPFQVNLPPNAKSTRDNFDIVDYCKIHAEDTSK